MASAKGLILSAIGRLALREATVSEVRELAPGFRAITLAGAALREVEWTPGDKLQVVLPSRDVRTYTPVTWNHGAGSTQLVVFDHGIGPGAAFWRSAQPGAACRFLGPQRSVVRQGPRTLLFGDETSVGVASALGALPGLTAVLEVGDPPAVERALAAIPLTLVAIRRTPGDDHLADCARALLDRGQEQGELLLTGRAHAIREVRRQLPHARRTWSRSRPYWAPGKTGLD